MLFRSWYRDSDDFSFFIRIHRDFWIILALFFQAAERVCLANCGRFHAPRVISFCGKREPVAFGVSVAAGIGFILFCLSVRPGSFVSVRVCLLGDDFVLGV